MKSNRERSEALGRAQLALTGLAIGDAIGGFFEFSQGKLSHHITERTLPGGIWHWTDDTQMALSVFSVLRQSTRLDQDLFASSLARHYEQARGYGMTTRAVLKRIKQNNAWRELKDTIFHGEGSFGNGAASRVPLLGAFYADDLPELTKQAELSAEVTHAHPESIAGTIAVATATALAWKFRSQAYITRQEFLDQVTSYIPESTVREKLKFASELDDSISIEEAVGALGNGKNATVQTTVPFALWCAADFRLDFEEAIWLALEGQGDCDTICAIVGGITAIRVGHDGIPSQWKQSCEPLPQWAFEESTPTITD
jgi:ADP-ribosylglycohydrolase